MPLKDSVPTLKFFGTFIAPILYIVCFASKAWVTTADTEWGLWSWCYTNFSDADTPANETKCHGISPGGSPGYYEAVRTLACFTLLAYILFFWTLNPKEGLGVGHTPCKIAAVACVGTVIVVGILGGKFKDDKRWKEENPFLGWCFWMLSGTAFLSFLMVIIFAKFHQMQNESNCSVSQAPPSRAPQRQASNANTSSPDRGQKATVFQTSTADGAGSSRSQRSSEEPPATSRTSVRGSRNDGDSGQFPVLNLPRYNIASEPGRGVPDAPPPSYEDVVAGGALSPPPPYTVTDAEHQRSG